MTQLTSGEIMVLFWGIIFVSILGVFLSLYNDAPIEEKGYVGETDASSATTTASSTWISNLISALPKPFDDANILIISSIFITPVVIMLSYIAVRALKDLISQWV